VKIENAKIETALAILILIATIFLFVQCYNPEQEQFPAEINVPK
jgi:hypothetical protein